MCIGPTMVSNLIGCAGDEGDDDMDDMNDTLGLSKGNHATGPRPCEAKVCAWGRANKALTTVGDRICHADDKEFLASRGVLKPEVIAEACKRFSLPPTLAWAFALEGKPDRCRAAA